MFTSEIKSKTGEDISILVKLDNHPWSYICECGDASNLTIKEIQNTNAIFISHTHIDHFINFDTVIRHQVGIQRRVTICGPKGIANQVQSKIKGYTWNLVDKDAITYEIREVLSDDKIVVYEIEPPVWELKEICTLSGNTIFEEKSFVVTSTLLDHKTPTLAYKFKENSTTKIDIASSGFSGGKWVKELKDAFENNLDNQIITIENKEYPAQELFHLLHIQKGDTLGIILDHSANTENHLKIKEHFSNTRKVFIESFYKDEDKELAVIHYHSYASMSAKVMKDSSVKEAIPVHFSRKYNENEIEELITEFNLALNSSNV
ncbi:MBL fold metallo-hydrolase [Aquimarina sediminis]|uniref:peptidase n=1 Tax=Aquimarina sediminis TaxID=2070536 RepID=UPI000CA07870|nr:peptidase [Aquimarina sediminis]